MRYLRRDVRTERMEESVADFLFGGGLASAVCEELDSSPGALLLDHLIPISEPGETKDDWLVRQVREIFAHYVQTDDWQGAPNGTSGIRTCCTVEDVLLGEDDRRWLIERYAHHPEVVALWEEARRESQIAELAA